MVGFFRFENAYLQFVFSKICSILLYRAFVVIKLKDMS